MPFERLCYLRYYLLIRCGVHPNVLQLIGLCEEKEALFIVLEDSTKSLKQVLLDSRALIHYPVFAEKNQRISTMEEETILEIMRGVAKGMEHLAKNRVTNKYFFKWF